MKRMLIVLPMSFLLVLGGSFFVSATAGDKLNNWYKKQFSDTDQFSKEDLSFMEAVIGDLTSLISKLDKEIEETRTLSEAQSMQNILDKNERYITVVQETKEELKAKSEIDSEAYKKQKIEEEKQKVQEDSEEVLDEILGN